MSLFKRKKKKRARRSKGKPARSGEPRSARKGMKRRSAPAGPPQDRQRRPPRRPLRAAGRHLTKHLGPRTADVLGVSLIVLAVLAILGVWASAGGLFGKGLRFAVLGLFGPIGYATPVVAGYWAFLLLKGAAADDRGRMLVGLTIGAAGVFGVSS